MLLQKHFWRWYIIISPFDPCGVCLATNNITGDKTKLLRKYFVSIDSTHPIIMMLEPGTLAMSIIQKHFEYKDGTSDIHLFYL